MAGYAEYTDYCDMASEPLMTEEDFDRLSFRAVRVLDVITTGVDGVRKLRVAFPEDEYDVQAVKQCFCEIVGLLYQIEQAERQAREAEQLLQREDGSVTAGLVTSVSAGDESVNFASGTAMGQSLARRAASDPDERTRLLDSTARTFLAGVPDKNGVNLMFMGPYPRRDRLV